MSWGFKIPLCVGIKLQLGNAVFSAFLKEKQRFIAVQINEIH